MVDQYQWRRDLFKALTTAQVSRNRFPETFSQGWSREAHKRYKRVNGLRLEVERLASVPGTTCWFTSGTDGLEFHLDCPPLQYKRVMNVEKFELEWLVTHDDIRALLDIRSLEG